ncbi:hypothetical protein DH86_00003252 [Scytalidium sp. 3C]|nr:hypothetical protein DH86_00003252 [Scytalidium sp. 3C]
MTKLRLSLPRNGPARMDTVSERSCLLLLTTRLLFSSGTNFMTRLANGGAATVSRTGPSLRMAACARGR